MSGIPYKTTFVWSRNKLYIFYKYKGIGLVPTGIDLTYRKHRYSTIQAMQKLASINKLTLEKQYVASDWYDLDSGAFKTQEFARFCKLIN